MGSARALTHCTDVLVENNFRMFIVRIMKKLIVFNGFLKGQLDTSNAFFGFPLLLSAFYIFVYRYFLFSVIQKVNCSVLGLKDYFGWCSVLLTPLVLECHELKG